MMIHRQDHGLIGCKRQMTTNIRKISNHYRREKERKNKEKVTLNHSLDAHDLPTKIKGEQ